MPDKSFKEEVVEDTKEGDRLLLNAKLENSRYELSSAKTLIRTLQADVERLEKVKNFLSVPLDKEPTWCKATKKRQCNHGIVCLILSDLHLDEVVLPSEMSGRNAYNREIADLRLKKLFDGVVEQAKYYHQNTVYDGCVVLMGGDTVSGDIHEEIRETNETPTPATIRYWTPKIASGLELLAEEFGHVRVAAVPGNHGRFSVKPRYKKRATDNADWLIAALLAERFANDNRFDFNVPESMDTFVQVYNTNILLTHGDQAGGGSGIGGIFPPIMRLKARKQANNNFDWMVLGHFHQYVHSQGITINNSLKGWDEFALGHNFVYSEPSQGMFIVTAERGVTWPIEIFVKDRKKEGW